MMMIMMVMMKMTVIIISMNKLMIWINGYGDQDVEVDNYMSCNKMAIMRK